MVEVLLLRRRQPVAVIRNKRRISLAELDLHRVVERPGDHRNGIEDDGKKIDGNDGHDHVGQQTTNEPHSGLLLRRRGRPRTKTSDGGTATEPAAASSTGRET